MLALIATATGGDTRSGACPFGRHRIRLSIPVGRYRLQANYGSDGTGGVFCDIGTYRAPPYAPECDHDYEGWGYRFSLDQIVAGRVARG